MTNESVELSKKGAPKVTVPNVLSTFRILAGPVLVLIAWLGWEQVFVGVYLLCLLSDWADGFMARALHETSDLGARLDSWGDLAMVVSLPLSILYLRPDILENEWPYIATGLASYSVPTLIGILKYGRPTSYHTWGGKLCAAAAGCTFLILLVRGPNWPFRLCVPIIIIEAIHEIVMTAMLPRWVANVPSAWHAWQKRKLVGGQ